MSSIPMHSTLLFSFKYTTTSISIAHISIFSSDLPPAHPRLDACCALPVNNIAVADGTFLAAIAVVVCIAVSPNDMSSQFLFNAWTDRNKKRNRKSHTLDRANQILSTFKPVWIDMFYCSICNQHVIEPFVWFWCTLDVSPHHWSIQCVVRNQTDSSPRDLHGFVCVFSTPISSRRICCRFRTRRVSLRCAASGV